MFSNLKDDDLRYLLAVDKPSTLIDISGKTIRLGMVQTAHGSVYAITSDKDYIKSSRSFITEIHTLANTLEKFESITAAYKERINKSTKRLIHNLTTLNAHNIQEIYSLIPQELFTSKTVNLLKSVETIVESEKRDTALSLLKIAKNNAAMKSEFSVFNKLFDENPRLEKRNHNVHKVLMNVLYLFFPDFTDKNVRVNVSRDCNEAASALFDYDSIHVAFYHLFDNSVKYIKPDTELDINISELDLFVILEISMTSLQIGDHERERIFTEEYSGEFANKTAKAGNGIGMYQSRKILELNGSSISVDFDSKSLHEKMGVPYQTNVFRIKLNRGKNRKNERG